ncbi:MAG: HAMP domain-containing histidine kinase [Clostridia bacterium]|nr:HAMP domain-containing histidine kinase [Clostridia bacterium]
MKPVTIKTRISIWYAGFTLLIVGVLLACMLISQHVLSKDYYLDRLMDAIDAAAEEIHLDGGQIRLSTESDSGVRITVLDEDENLLIGSRSFTVALQEEVLRVRGTGEDANYYLLDKPVTLEDGRNVWLRAYISSSLTERINHSIRIILLVALPILLAALIVGGYFMTRRAFRPIDELARTAESISDSSDLQQRIHIEGQADEVGQLAQTFDGMFDRLNRSLENEKRFISDASHELRTPLSVICAQSEYALKPGRSMEEKDAALRVIFERGKRSSEMLGQMLLLSRMDYQRLILNLEEIDLAELVYNLAQEFEIQAAEKNIRIECAAEGPVFLNCDEMLIMRMLMNLIQNAILYGREGGFIRIGAAEKDGEIRLWVQDNGAGIPEAEQPKIWRRFYRVKREESRANGTGLGLSIVKWIAEAHGGALYLDSRVGKGSTFTISWNKNQ